MAVIARVLMGPLTILSTLIHATLARSTAANIGLSDMERGRS